MTTITLKDVVVNILHMYDPVCARLFNQIYESDPNANDPLGHMNQFWRVQFAMFPAAETSMALKCLQNNVATEEWLRLFRDHVAPLVARYRLPSNVDYHVAMGPDFDVDLVCERLTGIRSTNYG